MESKTQRNSLTVNEIEMTTPSRRAAGTIQVPGATEILDTSLQILTSGTLRHRAQRASAFSPSAEEIQHVPKKKNIVQEQDSCVFEESKTSSSTIGSHFIEW